MFYLPSNAVFLAFTLLKMPPVIFFSRLCFRGCSWGEAGQSGVKALQAAAAWEFAEFVWLMMCHNCSAAIILWRNGTTQALCVCLVESLWSDCDILRRMIQVAL